MTRPTLDEQRQAAQLAFLASGDELELGSPQDCPMPPAQLAGIVGDEPWVVQRFDGGLTAQVFRLRLDGRDWTLKRARTPARVQNVDGRTSFLNEIQRRADFLRLRRQGVAGLEAIAETSYASLRRGILLSPWIEGETVRDWDERRLRQAIDAGVACHAAGLFDWDPSPGNILDDGRRLRLFDFGYMYRFDPLTQFNSAGHGDDQPRFHPVERLETRNLFGCLLELEQRGGEAAAIALFRTVKQVAIDAYRRLRDHLASQGATGAVLVWLDGIVERWQKALAGDLAGLYLAEGWRSHALDLDDDLSGRTCTPMTLARADWLIDRLRHRHAELVAAGALLGADLGRGRDPAIEHHLALRRQAQALQIAPA